MQATPLTPPSTNAFAPFAWAIAAIAGTRSSAVTVRQPSMDRAESTVASNADASIRARVLAALAQQPGWHEGTSNVFVSDGVVVLQGLFRSQADRRATSLAARHAVGVLSVRDSRVPAREWQALA